ncbi:alpha/beta fold hydrolase [Thermus filiformis]|uniref:AB hydrolase-1 domain-containing protein n=1 Tax=Thermus filiformis TaxID=276 RepID=A0A0D6XCF8_THEFI|nr:alpha/beta hydrolase [Thermus filiformis]KIX84548.1 hypothetical protein THFILI_07905 [Thermus filiformis]
MRFEEKGSGRPVVFIHGNFASRAWWREVLSVFPSGSNSVFPSGSNSVFPSGSNQPPKGYRFLAVDLPGFGETPFQGESPTISGFAQAVLAFLEEEGLEPVLVGHSLGGAVAMEAAGQAPDRVRGLVLLDSAPPTGFPTPEAYYPLLESYRQDRQALRTALLGVIGRPPPYFEELVDQAQAMHPGHFTGNARALAEWKLTRVYPGPVLVVHGEKDPLVPLAMAEITRAFFPKARLHVLPGLGHSPQLEDPGGFLNVLEGFLEEVPWGSS